ncbi:MAG: di-trans,poly-cis-decaprenylcistransferase [Dehalococcoidia bacterium]|nr:di-trans,poly-cis-decaprenylcistransferase [Dehalococcoidia bacterium]
MVVAKRSSELPLPRIDPLPRHVAVIMDGNGRWARLRGLSRSEGHRAGARNIRTVVERFAEHGVNTLTLFAFSTENWGRPQSEVRAIMRLGSEFIDRHLEELDASGVRIEHIGDPDGLPRGLRHRVEEAVERTAGNRRILLNIAFNYGGRADIVSAVRRLVGEGVRAEDVTEEAIASRLATAGSCDPDLLIRTGAEHRISNFLVWQSAYSEYYFSGALWPDFGAAEVDAALIEFSRRRRRFGLVSPGPGADG